MAEQLGNSRRTHTCGELRESDALQKVTLMGWVQKRRNLGGLIFIDLRDRMGITQVIFDTDYSQSAFDKAGDLKNEYVLAVTGEVKIRQSKNPNIPTGDIEIFASELKILSEAAALPMHIDDDDQAGEQITLKHRYLELRKPKNQKTLAMRHRIMQLTHKFMDENGFTYVETPVLYKPTPEGAREYMVPSRINPHKFYALPQSPQVFKQLLVCSGIDRYYQFAKCFRDEDNRADRQPEFTQLDIEMSFVDQEDVLSLAEDLYRLIFKEVKGIDLPNPFPRISYDEAMTRFGSDKPDTRFGFELIDLTDIFKGSDFRVFAGNTSKGSSVRCINIKGYGAEFSRKDISRLENLAKNHGAKGLAFVKLTEDGISSSIAKALSQGELKQLIERAGAESGDLVLIVADKDSVVFNTLAALRAKCAGDLGLIDQERYDILWVTSMPLYEYKEEENKYYAAHHPFTMPTEDSIEYMLTNPERCRAKAYDMVINGYETAGGSIRIHDIELQKKMFESVGLSEKDIEDKFGFLIEALKYGTPPHGGVAFGLDRLLMLMIGTNNIKDVIAFPKNQDARCLLTGAPTASIEKTLEELNISLREIKKKEEANNGEE